MPPRNPIEYRWVVIEMMDVCQRLEQLMNERGLNMYSLAKRSHLSWNTIKNIYSRKSTPTVQTLLMLCEGLGITMMQFFDEEGSGESLRLTAEQREVLHQFSTLRDEEKKVIRDMMTALNQARNR